MAKCADPEKYREQKAQLRARTSTKQRCEKCGRLLPCANFYKMRDGSSYPFCRTCLTANIDNRKPSTFTWILKEFDVPFIQEMWIDQCKRQYRKNPTKFGPSSVLGVYLRSMNMAHYLNYTYADSGAATQEYRERHGIDLEDPKDKVAEARKRLEAGDYEDADEKAKLEALSKPVDSRAIEYDAAHADPPEIGAYEKLAQRTLDKKLRNHEINAKQANAFKKALSDVLDEDAKRALAPPKNPKRKGRPPKDKPPINATGPFAANPVPAKDDKPYEKNDSLSAKVEDALAARQDEGLAEQNNEDISSTDSSSLGDDTSTDSVSLGEPAVSLDKLDFALDSPTIAGSMSATEQKAAKTLQEEAEALAAAEPKPKRGPGRPRKISVTNQEDVARVQDRQVAAENAVVENLTEKDVRSLTVKWGATYRPTEWLRLEQMYGKYAAEYEMNTDREQVLIQMCKVNLSMNNALDSGDVSSYSKLASTFDQLRKSGKFTEAQKQAEKESYLDSVGELVAAVERQSGIIDRYPYEEEDRDKVDVTLKDMKAYTYNLVKNEMGLGDIIESYIAKLEEDMEMNRKKDLFADLDDEDDARYESTEDRVAAEADALFGSFDEEEAN